jgi:hypothetical protein
MADRHPTSLAQPVGYDWLFLNEEPFSDEFKKLTQDMTPSKCKYGLIEPSHWHQPDWCVSEPILDRRPVCRC